MESSGHRTLCPAEAFSLGLGYLLYNSIAFGWGLALVFTQFHSNMPSDTQLTTSGCWDVDMDVICWLCRPGTSLPSPSPSCGFALETVMTVAWWAAWKQWQGHWTLNMLASPGHNSQNAKLLDLSHRSLCKQRDDLSSNDGYAACFKVDKTPILY